MERSRIFVHVPFKHLDQYLPKIERMGIQPEIYFSGDDLDKLDKKRLEKLNQCLQEKGIACTIHAPFYDLAIGSPDSFIREAVERRYRSFVPVVERLKPVCVVVHTGYDRWRYSSQRGVWLAYAIDGLMKLRELFPGDVKIAVENVFDEGPDILHELMDHIKPDYGVGVCLDVGHLNLFSKASLDEWLERLGNRIIELHIHDNDGREDRHWKPGRGYAPVFKLIRWAKPRDIIMTIEVHDPKDALETYKMLLDA